MFLFFRYILYTSQYLFHRWGYPLLSHSYLYHFGRLDHRHNFSPYFYSAYLTYPGTPRKERIATSMLANPLLSFVPQMGLSLGSGVLLGSRPSGLPFAWFVQTIIFVTFNKVCTSQVYSFVNIYHIIFINVHSISYGICGSYP